MRTVKVKTKDNVYVHPIQKLCLLENDLELTRETTELRRFRRSPQGGVDVWADWRPNERIAN